MLNNRIEEPRYEKIDGVIYNMSPSADYRHGIVNLNIFKHIDRQLQDNICRVFVENLDYRYDDKTDDFLIPDIMLLCDRKKLRGGHYSGVPRFIVETLSPSTALKDRTIKKDIYEKAGVEEYWIVDVNSKSIEIYVLYDGKYRLVDVLTFVTDKESRHYSGEDKVVLKSMPHIEIALKDIFDGTFEDDES